MFPKWREIVKDFVLLWSHCECKQPRQGIVGSEGHMVSGNRSAILNKKSLETPQMNICKKNIIFLENQIFKPAVVSRKVTKFAFLFLNSCLEGLNLNCIVTSNILYACIEQTCCGMVDRKCEIAGAMVSVSLVVT